VHGSDLGLLKRDKALQARYLVWIEDIKKEYGSAGQSGVMSWSNARLLNKYLYCSEVDYLMKHRLQWGKPDTMSLLRSSLDQPVNVNSRDFRMGVLSNGNVQSLPSAATLGAATNVSKLPITAVDSPTHFTANTPPGLISIIQNDWPYSG
jgi:hypothetical protein